MSIYFVIFGAAMMVSSAYLYRQQRSGQGSFARLTPGKVNTKPESLENGRSEGKPKFQGFRIEPGKECCQAAAELQQITFSHRDNLSLPLPECSKQVCTCRKTTVKERRTQDRRSSPDRRGEIRFTTGVVDRRAGKGRRKQDKLWSGGYVH